MAVQGHSRSAILVSIESPYLAPFQVMSDYMSKIFASDSGLLHAAVISCEYRHIWSRFFTLHFFRRMCRYIFNHFYAVGPEIYRIWRNNANYTTVGKVTDFCMGALPRGPRGPCPVQNFGWGVHNASGPPN